MRKFEYKYKVDEENKVVVARSTFAGKPVAGVAKCSPDDTFDIEKGKELASRRCTVKIAKRRLQRARSCYAWASDLASYWLARAQKMRVYELDSEQALCDAEQALANLESTM